MDQEKVKRTLGVFGICAFVLLIVSMFLSAGAVDAEAKTIIIKKQKTDVDLEVYCELQGRNIGSVDIQAVDTYYNVTNLSSGHCAGVNTTDSQMVIVHNGTYSVNAQFAFSDGVNTEFHLALGVNGVTEEHCHTQRNLGVGGDVGSASFTCIDYFDVGDVLTVLVENVDNTNDPVIQSINLNVHMLGNANLSQAQLQPSAPDQSLQFNDGGNFGGSAFLYDDASKSISYEGTNLVFGLVVPRYKYNGTFGSFEAGLNTSATNYGAVAFGLASTGYNPPYQATASGLASFAVNGRALDTGSIAIGIDAYSGKAGTIAIGGRSVSNGSNAIAIGQQAYAEGNSPIAIGVESKTFEGGIAIGVGAENHGVWGFSLGRFSNASADASGVFNLAGGASPIPLENNKTNSWLFGFSNLTMTSKAFEIELDKGVRIGATTGETITMDGDDLYVQGELETGQGATIGSLAGTYTGGSAHVCVYNNGTLYTSEGACP